MKSAILEPDLKNQPKSSSERERRYIKWFLEIGIEDVPLVGGKTASLGEMFRELAPRGVKVPDGFAITAHGYWYLLQQTGLGPVYCCTTSATSTRMIVKQLQKPAPQFAKQILAAKLPHRIARPDIACIRSVIVGVLTGRLPVSPCAAAPRRRTCPTPALPGNRRLISTCRAIIALLDACRRCFASLFTDRAISYRVEKGSTISRSRCPSACSAWCAPTSAAPASCSRSTPRPVSAMRCSSTPPTASAKTSCKARSIRTNTTSSSRR